LSFVKEFAAKEKLEIVSGAAPPPFRIFAGGLPRRLRRRNAFGLIQGYYWSYERRTPTGQRASAGGTQATAAGGESRATRLTAGAEGAHGRSQVATWARPFHSFGAFCTLNFCNYSLTLRTQYILCLSHLPKIVPKNYKRVEKHCSKNALKYRGQFPRPVIVLIDFVRACP